MSSLYIVKIILTIIIVVVLLVAISKRNSIKMDDEKYSEDVLRKAKEYRESGEAERFRQQIEEAELNEFLNHGFEDDDN